MDDTLQTLLASALREVGQAPEDVINDYIVLCAEQRPREGRYAGRHKLELSLWVAFEHVSEAPCDVPQC